MRGWKAKKTNEMEWERIEGKGKGLPHGVKIKEYKEDLRVIEKWVEKKA